MDLQLGGRVEKKENGSLYYSGKGCQVGVQLYSCLWLLGSDMKLRIEVKYGYEYKELEFLREDSGTQWVAY